MPDYASASVEKGRPDQFYARRPGDEVGVFANEIAKVLSSKNSDKYYAKPKDGNVDSWWQVLVGGKETIALEVKIGHVQLGEEGKNVLSISPEEMKYSAINSSFREKHGVNFYPDRIFEVEGEDGFKNLEVTAWEAYLSLSPSGRKDTKPKPSQQISV